MDVLAPYVAAGGSVHDAAKLVGIRPSTVKRHLADLRARSGLTTEQLIYSFGPASTTPSRSRAAMSGWPRRGAWHEGGILAWRTLGACDSTGRASGQLLVPSLEPD